MPKKRATTETKAELQEQQLPLAQAEHSQLQKITAAGVYDGISMDWYHADCCDGPSVSSTGLKKVEKFCGKKYWATSPLNPKREPHKDTEALSIGKAAHAYNLEGKEIFFRHTAVKPKNYDGRTNEGKAWLRENSRPGVTIISYQDWMKIRAMAAALAEHEEASKVFTDGKAEQSMFWKDPQTGVWLKSRPDWLPASSRFFPDYKTCICAKDVVFEVDAHRNLYHMSAALMCAGAKTLLGMDKPLPYLVAQEKDPPYIVEIYPFEEDAIEWGEILNRRAIDIFARGMETGKWPSYNREIKAIRMPKWMEYQLMERSEAGEFKAPVREYTAVTDMLDPEKGIVP